MSTATKAKALLTLHNMTNNDLDKMLAECIPGGDYCDPQHIADAIREWHNHNMAQRVDESCERISICVGGIEHSLSRVKRPAKAKPATKKPATCKCSLRTKALGDGCAACNPELAAEMMPKKKPAQKAARVVARLAYEYPSIRGDVIQSPQIKQRLAGESAFKTINGSPVLVLPADAASVERMVRQGAAFSTPEGARAVLAAIGISAPKKGGRT